jgi:aminopeptidase N
MENWGLITYNEEAFLYNQSKTSILDKRAITSLISHEIAHQWVSFDLNILLD